MLQLGHHSHHSHHSWSSRCSKKSLKVEKAKEKNWVNKKQNKKNTIKDQRGEKLLRAPVIVTSNLVPWYPTSSPPLPNHSVAWQQRKKIRKGEKWQQWFQDRRRRRSAALQAVITTIPARDGRPGGKLAAALEILA